MSEGSHDKSSVHWRPVFFLLPANHPQVLPSLFQMVPFLLSPPFLFSSSSRPPKAGLTGSGEGGHLCSPHFKLPQPIEAFLYSVLVRYKAISVPPKAKLNSQPLVKYPLLATYPFDFFFSAEVPNENFPHCQRCLRLPLSLVSGCQFTFSDKKLIAAYHLMSFRFVPNA